MKTSKLKKMISYVCRWILSRTGSMDECFTNDEVKYIIDLYREMTTQDNRATASPYFFQIMNFYRQPNEYNGDEVMWVCPDGVEFETIFDACECERDNGNEWFNEYESKSNFNIESKIAELGYNEIRYEYKYTLENCFFTCKAAKLHAAQNPHHYGLNPETNSVTNYVSHAYHNGEMEKIQNILKKLGKQLVIKSE